MWDGTFTDVNTNPLMFEDLAVSLATLTSFLESGDMDKPIASFEEMFTTALREPASFDEVTSIATQSESGGDRRSGRAAWLLSNIEDLDVCGVHAQLWHNNKGEYSVPLLQQLSLSLEMKHVLGFDDIQLRGRDSTSLLDVVGVKRSSIVLVQTISSKRLIDSAVKAKTKPTGKLFRGAVFCEEILDGSSLETLQNAYRLFSEAFPGIDILTYALVLHPDSPDFELYGISLGKRFSKHVVLKEKMIKKNSLDYQDSLDEDHTSLWTLPHRLNNPYFRGLPPCRGGRTLMTLASLATQQLNSDELIEWNSKDISEKLKIDFGFDIPRDKLRHDLEDRLQCQGFIRKWRSKFYLTMKGIVRYEYSLAKYTTVGSSDPMEVLNKCIAHRKKIILGGRCI